MKESHEECYIEYDVKPVEDTQTDLITIDEEQNQKLVTYLTERVRGSRTNRLSRLRRFARVDQLMSTWQKLSAEDSKREQNEDVTGKLQAIPMNLPIAQSHIDDSVAFFAEIFAPIGGNFYALPGKKNRSEAMKALAKKMDQDAKLNQYYQNVCDTMRTLLKYNIGGFEVEWKDAVKGSTGYEAFTGNAIRSLDMYNTFWDETITDVVKIAKKAEWAGYAEVANRLELLRGYRDGAYINVDKLLGTTESKNEPGTNYGAQNQAEFYRFPPRQTKIEDDGSDSRSSFEDEGVANDIDWDSFGLGLNDDTLTNIQGFEILNLYCWINPVQFDLDDDGEDSLELWRFKIANGKQIIELKKIDALEIPMYFARVNRDDMREAARSVSEYLRPFQRLVSFLLNTHVEAIRSAIWGIKAIDPEMFDPKTIQNGETSGLLISKKPGRDVKTGIQSINTSLDTRQNLQDAGAVMEYMKQFFPNQALPAQIAGMDRAVNSQVSAVLQGAMRKLHMFARLLDSGLMMPVRMCSYKNIALYDPDKSQFKDIKNEEVAELLDSGLGQINREAAAGQLKELIFALIQNPDSATVFGLPDLFALWSGMLNIGTDLGEFVNQQQPAPMPGQPVPGAQMPTESTGSMPGVQAAAV